MTKHFVVSKKTLARNSGQKYVHKPVYDGETYRPKCGSDMNIPVLVHKQHVEVSDVTPPGYVRCSACDWNNQ